MSYPDPPPPPYPFMVPPQSDGNADGFWPQIPMKGDYLDSNSQFEQPPPFNNPRNSENNPPNPNFVIPAPSNPIMNPPIPPMNRGTAHIFYKTRNCTKFLEGICKKGDSCTFAHGPEDLREPPSNWQELVKDRGTENWSNDQKIIRMMKICKKFYNGEECPYGEKCNFLHKSPAEFRNDVAVPVARTRQSCDLNKQLYSNSDVVLVNTNTNSDALRVNDFNKQLYSNSDAVLVNINANSDAFRATMKNWKTKICNKWEVGMCTFGERCHYAHGESELQVPNELADTREVMMYAAGSSIAPYPTAIDTVSDMPPAIPASPIKDGEAKKGFAKLAHKKINHIYGDWLDDMEDI